MRRAVATVQNDIAAAAKALEAKFYTLKSGARVLLVDNRPFYCSSNEATALVISSAGSRTTVDAEKLFIGHSRHSPMHMVRQTNLRAT